MSRIDDILKTIVVTLGTIAASMAITYALCAVLGENKMIRTSYALLISFIAPLILAPIVCAFFINLNNKLKVVMKNVRTLEGLVPICTSCKKIRDDQGYWHLVEQYIEDRSEASFTHSMCPQCAEEFYGQEDWYVGKGADRKINDKHST